jgi:hypothetical protein
MKKLFIAFILVASFIVGCNDNSKKVTTIEKATNDSGQSIDRNADSLLKTKKIQDSIQALHRKDSVLLRLTDNILATLKNKKYSAFANYIHPVLGIRFSPYAFVDTINNIKFSKQKFINEAGKAEQDMIVWGSYDGTGDPIRMKLNNYMQRFVYDVDFIKPEQRSVNKFIGEGNSLNNLDSVYKTCDFTESHFSGIDKKYEGHDWRTLRLVFKERNGKYFLVGIIHDEWTI